MKRILSILAAVVALGLVAAPAQAQLGIAAGLNFDNLSDVDVNDSEASFDNATGYHIGVFYDLAVGPIGVRPGVFYRKAGDVRQDIRRGNVDIRDEFNLSLVEIPIDLRLRMAALPLLTPYVLGGPVFALPTSEDDEFDAALEDWTISANIGAGVEVSIPGLPLTLYPELRYSFGVSRFFNEEYEFQGQTFRVDDSGSLNAFMVRLGIAL